MDEPINPVLSGLMKALSFHTQMQHASLQREQMDRMKHRDAREEKIGDFNTEFAMMKNGSKPLASDGTYGQDISLPTGVPGMPDQVTKNTRVPTDPERTLTTPGAGRKYYVPSQDEADSKAFEAKLRETQALTDVKTQAATTQLGNKHVFDLDLESKRIDGRKQLQTSGQAFTGSQNDKARANTLAIATGHDATSDNNNRRTTSTSTANNMRTVDAKTGGAGGGRGLTPNAEGVQKRFDRKDIEKAQAENQKDQTAEQNLWGQLGQLTTKISTGKNVDSKGAEVDLNPSSKQLLQSAADAIKKKIEVLQKAQKQRIERFGGTYSNGADGGAGANTWDSYKKAKVK